MNVGFDLDKIFINVPPFIPKKIIDFLYKGKTNGSLKYRIPSKAEQIIRAFSHYPVFRPPISKNLNYIRNLAAKNKNKYFLISSRFSFLKKSTDALIRRYNFEKIFDSMYFNTSDTQPHHFKNKMIKKLNLDIYVDDDLDLLKYLAEKNLTVNFFWLNQKINKRLSKNLSAVKDISDILN